MNKEKLADIFSIEGAKMIEMGPSRSVRELSGASKENLENVFDQTLTPMKNYAQSVQKLSGVDKDAAEKIFDTRLSPMKNYGENVPPLFNALMQAIDKGYTEIHDVNKPNDALQLSAEAEKKIERMAKEVPMAIYKKEKSARSAS